MKYSVSRMGLVCTAMLIATCWSTSEVLAADFQAGEEFVVAQSGVALMRGSNTLATLSQGQRYKVLGTEGEWIGTRAVINGQTVGGWVRRSHVMTPSQYAVRRTTRRSYSYQPGLTAGSYSSPSRGYSRSSSGGRLIMGSTPYGPSYWRADRKITGY